MSHRFLISAVGELFFANPEVKRCVRNRRIVYWPASLILASISNTVPRLVALLRIMILSEQLATLLL